MKNLLVVQNNLVERLTAPLAKAAHEREIVVHDLSSIDDMSLSRPLPSEEFNKTLIFGSIGFVHMWAAHEPRLRPWVFWNDEAMSAQCWAYRLGEDFINHEGFATTAGEVATSNIGPRHYRPLTTTKKIAGSVMTPTELKARDLPDNFTLWSSPPTTIDAEVRIWVINGRIACYSMYRLDNKMFITSEHTLTYSALLSAAFLIERWQPCQHFVIDLGLQGLSWRVVEYNPIHSAGWYAADPGHFLDAYFEFT